jgi:precorrin-6A synthase
LGTVEFRYLVVPGVTSVQALAAAYGMPLNRVGEPIHITPARRLAGGEATSGGGKPVGEAGGQLAGLPDGLDSAVVMLDRGFTAAGFTEPGLEVFWGAYLGTPDQELIAGPLAEVADEIIATRARLRAEHGWIMDTYLVRRARNG